MERRSFFGVAARVAITASNITKRFLRSVGVRVERFSVGLCSGSNWLLTLGPCTGLICGRENFSAAQIFVGVDVLRFLILFAGAFLASGSGDIL